MKDQTSYTPVNQLDDLEAAPVIVDVVNSIEVTAVDEDERAWDTAKFAGCVGATAGCLTGGFFLSLVCCSGCIYAAKEEQGFAGDIARSCGTFAVQANKMMRDINDKHHVVENGKVAAAAAWNKAKDANQEYQIVDTTKDCIKAGVRAGMEFSREHKVAERTASSVRAVISTVVQELSTSNTNQTTMNDTVRAEPQDETVGQE